MNNDIKNIYYNEYQNDRAGGGYCSHGLITKQVIVGATIVKAVAKIIIVR